MKDTYKTESYKIKGKDLIKKIKELIKEGNIRRISIKDQNDRIIIDIPLTIGILGTLIAPPLAVIAAVTALVTECTIAIERNNNK